MKFRTLVLSLLIAGGFIWVTTTRKWDPPSFLRTTTKASGSLWSGPSVQGAGLSTDEQNNIDIYKTAHLATVNISSTVYRRGWFGQIVPEPGTGSGFLIDGDGVIVWHPDEKYMYRSLGPLAEDAQERIAADQRFRRARVESLSQQKLASAMVGAKQAGHASFFSSLSQREEIAGFAPVPGHDWVVGVSESRDSFTAPLDLLFRTVLVSVAIVGGVFVVLGLLFARTIVRPLERLTAAAHALKSGDYQHANVEVRSGDEVGELSRTFNVMIDVLRQRERESLRNRALGSREEEP